MTPADADDVVLMRRVVVWFQTPEAVKQARVYLEFKEDYFHVPRNLVGEWSACS